MEAFDMRPNGIEEGEREMQTEKKWSEFAMAREAFWDERPDFASMDHADLIAWHAFATEAEQGELDALSRAAVLERNGMVLA